MAHQRQKGRNPKPINIAAELANSLLNVVRHNKRRRALELIKKGADVNFTFRNGKTLLLSAIFRNSHIVSVLIDAGADVNATDDGGKTALMYCAEHAPDNEGRYSMQSSSYYQKLVTQLIQKKADVNMTDNNGKTALIYALQSNNEIVAGELIKAGADLKVSDNQGMTALMYAVQSCETRLVAKLLDAGADVNITDNEGKTVLMYSVSKCKLQKVKYKSRQSGYKAVDTSDVKNMTPSLLMAGADLGITDNQGRTALMYAVQHGPSAVEELVKAGADVNVIDNEGKTALMHHALQGTKKKVHWIYHHEEFDTKDRVALLLITAGADINVTDHQGKTSLNYSVECNKKDLACALINAGADINVVDNHAKTSLFLHSSRIGNKGAVQQLVKTGVDINVTDESRKSALIYAVENENYHVVQEILDAGADVNITDYERKSALMYALENNDKQLVHAILDAGADVNIADCEGKSVLMYALENDKDLAHAILDAGADVNAIIDDEGKSVLMNLAQYNENSKVKPRTTTSISNVHGEALITKLIKGVGNIDIMDCHRKTALMYAIQFDNTAIACALIDAGADHKIIDDDGRSALFYAVITGNKSMVKRFIKVGTDLNIADSLGMTALMHAVQNSKTSIVDELLAAGADVDKVDNKGRSALTYCAQDKDNREISSIFQKKRMYDRLVGFEDIQQKIISKLIRAGANVNIPDRQGKTSSLHEVMACALLDAGADHSVIDDDGKSALFYAAINGNESVVQRLIKAGADMNITDHQDMTALMHAAKNGRAIVANELIIAGADVNMTDDKGRSALIHYAQNSGKTYSTIDFHNIGFLLIKAGADIDLSDNQKKTALMYALHKYNILLAHKLIDAEANVSKLDNQGKSALSYCFPSRSLPYSYVDFDYILHCHKLSVSCKLIKAGADVNLIDDEGKTPLMYAAQYDSESLVIALIEAGADVNVSDVKGRTALVHSLQRHHKHLALVLIKAGANVNTSDHKGQTALFHGLDYEDVIHALIEDGHASVNKKDRYGRSVLFYSFIKSVTISHYLLEKGGNLNLKDNCGMNVISFFIDHMMSEGKMNSVHYSMSELNILQKERKPQQTIVEAIFNSVFCKIFHCMEQDSDVKRLIHALDIANRYNPEKSVQEKKIIGEVVAVIRGGNISRAIELLVKLGANPNYADADGNTALHYATCLPLVGTYESVVVMTMCRKLEDLGVSFNAKNHENETPLLFCLSKKEWIKTSKSSSKVKTLVEVCKFLLENGSMIEETTKSEKSVFHLVVELFQEGLCLNEKIGKEVLAETMELLELFPSSRTLTEETVNKRDANLNSPLHLLAMLELHLSSKNDSSVDDYNTLKKERLATIFKHLMNCKVKLYGRNKSDETPMHLCKSWTAVKLLIDAGANPKVFDIEGRSPLLVASKNISLRGYDHIYQDVSQEPKAFWKTVLDNNLDPWAVDKRGTSVLSILIQEETFHLSKALVEVACEENYIQSDTIAVSLLNAVCQDSSTRKQWKSILVEKILKSRKTKPISYESNEDTALHLCCRNIIKPSEEPSPDEEIKLFYNKANTSVISAKTSVHWTIAKQLLTYGSDCNALDTSGQSCLDIAKKCSSLKSLLLKPLDIDEVPLAFPWTSISTKYKPILSKVARRQECKWIDSFWCHETKIQEGSFGLIFAGMNEKDGREVAIKRIEKLRNQQLQTDKKEIKTLIALADCVQVVKYLSFTEDEHFCYVILELMEGNLDDYLDGAAFDDAKSVQLCGDVLNGLNYLHQQNIFHRDLKPSNILFKTYPKLCLKIADFGLSRRIDSPGNYTYLGGSVVGTRCWIAPEVLKFSTKETKQKTKLNNGACDVFSAGLVLYYILSRKKHPFSPADCKYKGELQISNETEANVINDRKESFDGTLFSEATDLMLSMLDSDPNKRPTAAMTLTHPFFWSEKKKMDFLSAVGNQPEFECPRALLHKRTLPLSILEKELDGKVKNIMAHPTWIDARYVQMPTIYKEMTQKRRLYNTSSVVELVRFIRNTLAHVSADKRPTLVKQLVLEDFVFLEYFPNLVMEVFKCIKKHGWDSRKEIKYQLG